MTPKAWAAVTKSDALQLKTAVQIFNTEYQNYPLLGPEVPHPSDFQLMRHLSLPEVGEFFSDANFRQIEFYSGHEARRTVRGKIGNGIKTNSDGSKELLDPWGNHFRVIMDTNGDGKVPSPVWTHLREPIPQSVIVWSPGPDGDDSTAKDNITTW